jgi:hypothetical protein
MGGQSTTQKAIVPDDLRQLYRGQTGFVLRNLPAVEQLTATALSGQPMASNPYVSGLYSTIQQGTDRAAEQIRQRTPRGPAQDYAIAETLRAGGQQRSALDAQQRQMMLQALLNILGAANPQAQVGQKSSSPSEFGLSLGPLSFSTGL